MTKFNLNVLKKKIDKYNTYMHECSRKEGKKHKKQQRKEGQGKKQ